MLGHNILVIGYNYKTSAIKNILRRLGGDIYVIKLLSKHTEEFDEIIPYVFTHDKYEPEFVKMLLNAQTIYPNKQFVVVVDDINEHKKLYIDRVFLSLLERERINMTIIISTNEQSDIPMNIHEKIDYTIITSKLSTSDKYTKGIKIDGDDGQISEFKIYNPKYINVGRIGDGRGWDISDRFSDRQ